MTAEEKRRSPKGEAGRGGGMHCLMKSVGYASAALIHPTKQKRRPKAARRMILQFPLAGRAGRSATPPASLQSQGAPQAVENVCFTCKSGHGADIAPRPLCANGLNRSRGKTRCGGTVSPIARWGVLS
jgi:hypothetical protein